MYKFILAACLLLTAVNSAVASDIFLAQKEFLQVTGLDVTSVEQLIGKTACFSVYRNGAGSEEVCSTVSSAALARFDRGGFSVQLITARGEFSFGGMFCDTYAMCSGASWVLGKNPARLKAVLPASK